MAGYLEVVLGRLARVGIEGIPSLVLPRSLFAALLLFLVACDPGGGSTTSTNDDAGVVVDLVVDGDTFRSSDGREFRLDGINAPEFEECFYEEAAAHLIALIEEESVAITTTGTDQFGRTLAQVRRGELWVNLDLVARGFAMATTPRDGGGFALIDAEDLAFADRVGMWAFDACAATGPIPQVRIRGAASVFDPPGPDDQELSSEQVTLVNEGATEIDLTGWSLRDESSRHRYRFTAGTALSPGSSITVTSADPGWDPGNSPVWNNSGDVSLLLDSFGRVVDRYRY